MKLGIHIDDLGAGVRGGVAAAARLGLDGVQVSCGPGELDASTISHSGRREFARLVERSGLVVSAVGAPAGCGLGDANANDVVVPGLVSAVASAREMGTSHVTLSLGPIGPEAGDPSRAAAAEALRDVARAAELHGVTLCVESGNEPPADLAGFLAGLSLPQLKVVCDPGALAMRGYGVLQGVRELAPLIARAYARDGRHGEGECDLGEGEVPWNEYVAELVAAGYDDFQIVRCTRGGDRLARAARAVDALRGM